MTVLGLVAPQAAFAAEPGVHSVTVALALGTTNPITASPEQLMSQAQAQIQALSDYWSTQSDGYVKIQPAEIRWLDVNQDGVTDQYSCSPTGAQMRARQAEAQQALGWTSGPNKNFMVLVVAGCRFGGVGTQTTAQDDGASAYLEQGGTAPVYNPLLAHEFGHNLSLGHAGLLQCPGGVSDGEDCPWSEYSDGISVMGSTIYDSVKDMNTPMAIRLGWLQSADYVNVDGSGSQTVRLAPFNEHAGVRSVQVVDPITGRIYWFEYATKTRNQTTNWTSTSQSTGPDGAVYQGAYGVRVLKEPPSNKVWRNGTVVIPMPASGTAPRSTAWPVGSTFTSASGGITMTVAAQDAGGATLNIVTRSDLAAPAAPAGLASRGTTVVGSAEPGATIAVTDANGAEIGAATADAEGFFRATLTSPQPDGAVLTLVATDASGNASAPAAVTVDEPSLEATVSDDVLGAGETLTATATGFAPGESVTGALSGGIDLGTQLADQNGTVTFAWTVPVGTAPGEVTAAFTGVDSGEVTAGFAIGGSPVAVVPTDPGTAVAAPRGAGGVGPEAPGDRDTLAATGATAASDGLIAGVLLLVGGGVCLWARRRLRTE